MAGVIDVTVHRPGQQVVHRQWQAPVLCSGARDDLKEEFGSGILCSGGSTVAVSRSAQLAPDQTYEYRVFPPRPAAGAATSTPAEAGPSNWEDFSAGWHEWSRRMMVASVTWNCRRSSNLSPGVAFFKKQS